MRLSTKLPTALFVLALAAPLSAQPRPLQAADVYALKDVGDPRISPDGRWVAYTVTSPDREKDKPDSDIYLVPLAGGEAIRLTAGDRSEQKPRFSPDGQWLAFLAAEPEGETQVWLMRRAGGDAVALTSYQASVSDLVWSPDSTRLALVVEDPDPAKPAGDTAGASDDRQSTRPIVVTRLQFKRDGKGYLSDQRTHVHVFDVATRVSRQLTSGPFDDSQPAWSPDGRTVAFTSNRLLPDTDAGKNSDIFVVPATGGIPRTVAKTERAESNPVFSPDGEHLVFVTGGDPGDMWYGASHVATVPVRGGTPKALTASLDRNVLQPLFSRDGRDVYFLLEDGGTQPLARIPLAGGAMVRVAGAQSGITAFDIGPAGEIVVLESSFHYPAEVSRVTAPRPDGSAGLERVTHVNDTFLAGIALGTVERITATSPDGTRVEAFVTKPPAYTTGKAAPAILWLHGGPASQYAAVFDFECQVFAAHGYAVIAPNPRGSTGYGTAFSRAIWADWGTKDTQDVLAVVDHVVKMGIADPDRLGVGGWSYGGILTNHVVTKSTRFKAATSGAGAANILAGYGTDHYQYEYEVELGLPWKTRETYLTLSSSFFDVEKIVTPVLYLCGQKDMNVPLLNNEQLYQAVRRVNKVPTELVIYPEAWHVLETPSHQQDRYERSIAWYDRFLKPRAAQGTHPAAETTSLLGKPLHQVELAPSARDAAARNVEAARQTFVKTPDKADTILWLGRHQAAAGQVRAAIETFTRGLAKFPNDARFYRHRGHRYITLRAFDQAIVDLTRASQLIAGKPDVDEPTLADPAVMSSETLNYAIWYHLGLAHYLKGDFEQALAAYRACADMAKGNDEQTIGISDWLYMTLRRLGRIDDAAAVLAAINPAMKVRPDQNYFNRLMMYKGVYTPEDLLRAGGDAVTAATYGYAVGNWYLYNSRQPEAKAIFRRIIEGANWMAFGYIAAEAELARLATR